MSQEKPQAGDIAVCSLGCVGLITSNEPVDVAYGDGNSGKAYVGIHLREHTFEGNLKPLKTTVNPGDPWSSRKPKVVGNVLDFAHFIVTALSSEGRI